MERHTELLQVAGRFAESASARHSLELHWHTMEFLQVERKMRSFYQYKAHSGAPLALLQVARTMNSFRIC
jgi:hypothetical protein